MCVFVGLSTSATYEFGPQNGLGHFFLFFFFFFFFFEGKKKSIFSKLNETILNLFIQIFVILKNY